MQKKNENRLGTFNFWYAQLELFEWAYEYSGNPLYLDKIIEYSRVAQRISPLTTWGYSFEAKYGKPGDARTRAIGLTLYLDQHSRRLNKIPKAEIQKAQDWLKISNPFDDKPKREELTI